MNLLSVRRDVGEFKKRYKWMALFVVSAFTLLFARMIQLQLVDVEYYTATARENITRTQVRPATRGLIRDTNGRVLATNRPAYNVYLTPQYLAPNDLTLIGSLMGLSPDEQDALQVRIDAVPAGRRAHQIRVFSDIGRDALAALETHQQDLCLRVGSGENQRRLSCIAHLSEPVRTYPFGALGAHAIGYLNEINGEELEELTEQGYRAGDRIGRTGAERAWEDYLRGHRGFRRVSVDARGHEMEGDEREGREHTHREPAPGRDLTLTLDMDLMRIVSRAFAGYPSGSVVVVDVNSGALRALYSKPSYDLGGFTSGLSHQAYGELRDNPFRPLIDKTLYESYYPGSTFKPFSALAALHTGSLEPSAHFECTGAYTLGNTRFRCTSVHGEVSMRSALVQSCNVYFYRLAEQVGLDRLARFAGGFGFGERTGLGINAEASGFIPSRAWYERVGRRFRLGYTLNTAIGQGDTRVTVVQLAMAYAALANNGLLYVPQLVESVSEPRGSVLESFEPRVRRRVNINSDYLANVISALDGVVNEPNGTAHDALMQVGGEGGVRISGKTGTAQVSRRARPNEDPRRAHYLNRAHSWFAGFGPSESPELAIVVLVEHGGAGGSHAAPVAIRILQEYLSAHSGSIRQSDADLTSAEGD